MIIPLPRWAMVAILVAVVGLVADMFLGDGWLVQHCIGWPLRMVGELVLKWGLALLFLLFAISFFRRNLVR